MYVWPVIYNDQIVYIVQHLGHVTLHNMASVEIPDPASIELS